MTIDHSSNPILTVNWWLLQKPNKDQNKPIFTYTRKRRLITPHPLYVLTFLGPSFTTIVLGARIRHSKLIWTILLSTPFFPVFSYLNTFLSLFNVSNCFSLIDLLVSFENLMHFNEFSRIFSCNDFESKFYWFRAPTWWNHFKTQ